MTTPTTFWRLAGVSYVQVRYYFTRSVLYLWGTLSILLVVGSWLGKAARLGLILFFLSGRWWVGGGLELVSQLWDE